MAFNTVDLDVSQPLLANPSGNGSFNVQYPDSFDTKIFSVDPTGSMIVKQSGLYSVELTTVILSTLNGAGTRGHYAIVDGNEGMKYGYTNALTNQDNLPNCTSLYSSFTLQLVAGQTITHRFRHNSPADIGLVGTDVVGTDYWTKAQIVLIMPKTV